MEHPLPTLGIIGGMGPATTARFYSQLIERLQARGARYNDDFPEMVIHSVRAPDNVDADVGAPLLDHMLRSLHVLERAGAAIISIPCNSAHIYIGELQREAQVSVLNMIEHTGAAVQRRGFARPLLLGTRSTLRAELYPRFGPGLAYTIPSSADQDRVTRIVMRACAGTVDDRVRAELLDVIAAYPEADCVVLGCTELPLVIDIARCDRPVFDSSCVLADATLAALDARSFGGARPCASC